MTSQFPDGDLDEAVELGAIDDRSVRVWVRFANRPTVQATLEAAGRPAVSETIQLSEQTDWTGVIRLTLPEPAASERFTIHVGAHQRSGHFAPAPGQPAGVTFGFGSCHMPYEEDADGTISLRNSEAGIYPAIRDDLRRANGQFFMLIGDQIYADKLTHVSVRRDLPGPDEPPPAIDTLVERYRENYRGFFNQTGMRALREAFPSLYNWDDADIFDNWGSTSEKTPSDFALFEAACKSYAEYQHSRNPDGDATTPPFHWRMNWGDIGFVALDLRGARDYEAGVMAGAEQWQWLLSWLAGEAAQQLSTLFVISGVPIAHTARWFTRLFDVVPARFAEPIRDRWSSTGYIDSRDQLLDALFAWEAAVPHRQVIILSGDVHTASAFTIRQRNGNGVIQQFTSSAMTTPLDIRQIVFNELVVHGTNLFEDKYRFTFHLLKQIQNYGGVRVEPLPGGGHRVLAAIRSWDRRNQRLRTSGRFIFTPTP